MNLISNYTKIAFRSMLRHKANAVINITGLAVGIAACTLIFMFVNNELSFDKFNSSSKNMYRMVFDYKFPDKLDHLSVAAPIAGFTVKREFPEVLKHTSVSQYGGKLLVKHGEKKFYEENIFVADSSFFNVFDYKLLQGDKNTVLNEPNTVVINESTAKKYFGKENPVGKTLEYDNNDGTFASYKVTGVFADVPPNSHLVFSALVSYKTLQLLFGPGIDSWHNAGSYVYVILKDNTDVKAFEKKIAHLYDRYADQYKNVNASIIIGLEPITDIHLRSDKLFDVAVKGNPSYVYIFSAVALFLLLIACINYVNLATAQGKIRMKEIGVKKVIGAGRKSLVGQFIFESALTVFASLLFCQLLLLLFLPIFNHLTALNFGYSEVYNVKNLALFFLLGLGIVLLAGIYPAFYLTSYSPVITIKGNTTSGEKGITLRKILVTGQFTVSIILIASTLIVRSQVNYMMEHDPGFNKSNIAAIRFQDTLTGHNYKAIKSDLLALKDVSHVSQTSTLPGDPPDRKITQVESKQSGVINEIPVEPIWVDWDYFGLMQVRLNEGRFFDRSHALDPRESFVVNESAARIFGWDKSIGKKIIWGRGPRARNGHVIGVTKDIYTGTLKNAVEPIVFVCDENPSRAYNLGYLLVRLSGENKEAALKNVLGVWSKYDKIHPPDYKFIDDNLTSLYSGEKRTNDLFQYMSLLTIFIACLGLFGLVSFSVSQRVKEIGIRKVLGATVSNITVLLSKDFMVLVILAFIIASPIAWYAMDHWLTDFAFRTTISWWMFLLAGFTAFVIAFATASVHSVKAAYANPTKSLRTE